MMGEAMRVLLAVMLLCYVLGIALLLFMLRRIRDHAESMDGAVKSERYRTSIWFWSDPKEIPKGSAPDLAGGAGVLCMALALGWLFLTQEMAL